MSKSLRSPRHTRLRQLLIDARKDGGWTQDQIAERLGRHQSFVAKYEGGERRLDLIELIDVAKALDRDPLELVAAVLRDEPRSEVIQPEA